ncbi:MAG: hypothetical protein CMJ90_04935 [Planctomycetes bacterium]|nr:hypothetical protein [Planctomycetota bacterium]
MSGWKKSLQGAALVALALVVGLPAITGGLIRDDYLYTTHDPHVTEPVGFATLLSSPLWPYEDVGLYRPLTTASLRLDFLLSQTLGTPITGERALVPHVHNLLLNGIGAALLFLTLLRLGVPAAGAFVAAAVFAVHPARSEAFLWISGRAECLMTAFALGAVLIVLGGTSWWRLFAAGACASCAFLAKEQGACLLVLVPLAPALTRRDRGRVLAVMAMAIVPWLVVRYGVLGTLGPTGSQQTMLGAGGGAMLLHGMGWLGRYALLLVWPDPLLHEYDEPAAADWLGMAVAGCVALASVIAWRRRGAPGFACALFVLPLLPALNLLHRTSEPFAERFLALPAAGALAWFAVVFPWERLRRPRLLTYAALVLLLTAAVRTGIRASDYKDEATLFAAQMQVAPGEAASWGLWGQLGVRGGDLAAACSRFARAVELAPDGYRWRIERADALFKRASAMETLDQVSLREAARELSVVVERWPMIGPAWSLLGSVEATAGNVAVAEAALRRAAALEPRDWRASWRLANILMSSGRAGEARSVVTSLVASLDDAARRRPWDFQPLAAAGRVLLDSAQPQAALMRLRGARRRALRAQDTAQIDELLRRAAGQRPAVR